MIEPFLAQLHSPDPLQRRQAIIALGRAKDPRALSALAEVYRTDPVPELREMALKAGRYIKQQAQPAAPPPYEPPPASTVAPRKKGLNTDAVERMLESHYKQESSGPATSAGSSWTPVYTGPGAAPEIAAIDAKKKRRKEKAAREGEEEHEATWGDLLIDLGLLFAVHVIGVITLSVVLPAILSNASGAMAATAAHTDFATALIDGVSAGFMTVLYAVIRYGAIFGVGLFLFSGEGSIMGIFHALVPIETGITLAYYLVLTLLGAFMLPELMPLGAQFFDVLSVLFQDAQLLLFGSLAVVVGILFWMAREIGRVMKFGTGMGFVCLFVGTLAFGFVNCAIFSMMSSTGLVF